MEDAHVVVLLEEIRGQFKVFGESLSLTRETLGAKIDAVAADVAVLKDDVAVLKDDVGVLKVDVADLKRRMTRVEGHLNGAPKRGARKKK